MLRFTSAAGSLLLNLAIHINIPPKGVIFPDFMFTFAEPDRTEALERMEKQVRNAHEWRDVTNTFFHRFSGIPDAHGRKIYI